MQATKKRCYNMDVYKEIILTCFSAFSDSSSIQVAVLGQMNFMP